MRQQPSHRRAQRRPHGIQFLACRKVISRQRAFAEVFRRSDLLDGIDDDLLCCNSRQLRVLAVRQLAPGCNFANDECHRIHFKLAGRSGLLGEDDEVGPLIS